MKAAERKMVMELMELSLDVIEKTKAYVNFSTSNHGALVYIEVMENGFHKEGSYDGWFFIVSSEDEVSEGMQAGEYLRAKKYLESLLKKSEEAA